MLIQRFKAEPLDQFVEAEGVEGAGEGVPGLCVCCFLLNLSLEWIVSRNTVITEEQCICLSKYKYKFKILQNKSQLSGLPGHAPTCKLYSFVIFAPALQNGNEGGQAGLFRFLQVAKSHTNLLNLIFRPRSHLTSWQGCWIAFKDSLTHKVWWSWWSWWWQWGGWSWW